MDDLIVIASKPSAIDDLLCNLKTNFAIMDLGNLNFFLGIEVLPNSSGLVLSQKHYIIDHLRKTNMLEAKPVCSPMAQSTSLSTFEEDPFSDVTMYRSTVRAFQYLSITRPDISFTINKLSRLCIALLTSIGNLSNASCVILSKLFILTCSCIAQSSTLFKPSLMPIGLVVMMIGGLLKVSVSF